MNQETTKSKMSESLLNKDVYCVCFTERDGTDILSDEFAQMRRDFFEGGQKPVKINLKDDVISGFNARLKGKLKKNKLSWKRTAGKMVTEESFPYNGGHAIIKRDYFGVVNGKIYFDKNHLWIKSEYFSSSNQSAAQVIFKPTATLNCVERFDYVPERQVYESTVLYPAPYMPGTAEQSIINANYGEPRLIVSTKDGLFCYCEKENALKREKALEEIKDGTIVLMPAWEVREGRVQSEQNRANARNATAVPSFESLNVPAKTQQPAVAQSPEKPAEMESAPEKPDSPQQPVTDEQPATQVTEFPEQEADLIQSSPAPKDCYIEARQPADSVSPAAVPAPPEAPEEPPEAALEPSLADQEETEEILLAARSIAPPPEAPSEPDDFTDEILLEEDLSPDAELPKVVVAGEVREYDGSDPDVSQIIKVARQSFRMPEIDAVSLEPLLQAGIKTEDNGDPDDSDILTAAQSTPPGTDEEAQTESLLSFSGEDAEVAAVAQDEEAEEADAMAPAIPGRKRIDQQSGITAYEGGYKDGKRDGFGAYYYRDGSLCYAGSFKEDQKNGLGVSFRASDHALHVTNWQEDRPGETVTLFDKDGNLKYSGKIVDGKKVGAGIAYDEDGNIFISKWQGGSDTGFGSVFDADGDLIYTGMWKNGSRHGNGTEFNKQGDVVFSGEWKEGVQWGGILYKSERGQNR